MNVDLPRGRARHLKEPTQDTGLMTSVKGSGIVALVALIIAILAAIRLLAFAEWDPTIFSAFGEEAHPTREYAEDRLGEVFLRSAQGHDGKFFYVQSNDPWVLDPDENAAVLDRPLYRSQRMFYPLLAGGGGVLGPEAITWAMLIVNVLAIGVGTWTVALIAVEMGGSPWWGLAFALNIGFISEMNIGGAGIVAATAAFGAVAALLKGRFSLGVLLLVIAALSREAMLIAAAGSAWWLWRNRGEPRKAAFALVGPVLAVGAWALYLRLRIGWESGVSEVQEIGVPFVGFFEAASDWLNDPVGLAVGVGMLLLFVLFTRRVLISDQLVGWAFLGFAALGVVLTRQVWSSYFDITRAVAPTITAFVMLMFLDSHRPPAPADQRTGVRL